MLFLNVKLKNEKNKPSFQMSRWKCDLLFYSKFDYINKLLYLLKITSV